MGTMNTDDDPSAACATEFTYEDDGPRGTIGIDALTTTQICEIDSVGKESDPPAHPTVGKCDGRRGRKLWRAAE